MTLASLINDLKQKSQNGKINKKDALKLMEERIVLPDDFRPVLDSSILEFEDHSYLEPSGDYFSIFGVFERPIEDVQHILKEYYERSKDLNLEEGIADSGYKLFWTPEDFQHEKNGRGWSFDYIDVESSVFSPDTTKPRLEQMKHHEISARTKKNKMEIIATGNYRKKLGELIEIFNPQHAVLSLSNEDAERILRAARKSPSKKFDIDKLEKIIKPIRIPATNLNYLIEGVIVSVPTRNDLLPIKNYDFGSNEDDIIIPPRNLTIPTSHIKICEELIGQPLLWVSPKQESKITHLIKSYSKDERLSDLQTFIREITNTDLGLIYNHSIITNAGAKEMIYEEIKRLSEDFANPSEEYDLSFYIDRDVKRFAREHFGEKVLDGFEDLSLDEYIGMLENLGYEKPECFEGNSKIERYEIRRFFGDGRIRHLFEFFKQSYEKNPEASIREYKEWYKNTEPRVKIRTSFHKEDASRLKALELPSLSKFYSFEIHECNERPYVNRLEIEKMLLSDEEILFSSKTSLYTPILLPLQEYVCKEMGIEFK